MKGRMGSGSAKAGIVLLVALLTGVSLAEDSRPVPAQDVGITKGLCVVLGDKDGRYTLTLARNTDLVRYLSLKDKTRASELRAFFYDQGLLGRRVVVDETVQDRVALADDLADVVVVLGQDHPPASELQRIVRPGGRVLAKGEAWVKPVPKGMDEWTHHQHGPDNNTVSNDQKALAPFLTKFLAKPHFSAAPAQSVIAGGRIFRAVGNCTNNYREWGTLNLLTARSAYNGKYK